jgi:two-component system cell cycle response regulator
MSGKILIVDDVATNRIVLKVKLGAACYHPLLAADGESCLRIAREHAPDLILLDHALRDMTGVDVLRHLRGDPATRDIPVVFLAGELDAEVRMQALQAGADDFLQKPVDDQLLMARLRNLVRNREGASELEAPESALQVLGLAEPAPAFEGPGRIALVADHVETAIAWRRDLQPSIPDDLIILTREAALSDASDGVAPPDIFVLEAEVYGGNGGLRLMSELRSRPQTRHAAICIVCPDDGPEGAAMAYDLGANEVLGTGFNPAELGLRLRKLLRRKRAADQMRASVQDSLRLSVIDPLTGLHNRRYAMPYLSGISGRARLAALPYSVMVIDLDRFKAVNDRWGHGAGDAVLIEVSRRLSENLRAGDLLARVGGEEFLVGLPDTGLAEAQVIAERLCSVVQARPIRMADGTVIQTTVSIGLAVGLHVQDTQPESVAVVMGRADHALLVAKSGGRNQVNISCGAA